MSNDSASGGPLVPASSPAPLEDDALEDFVHDLIAGITGLAGDLVRPRWQPEPPDMPEAAEAWCAFGIENESADWNAYVAHNPAGDGTDELQRHAEFTVVCSFYHLLTPRRADALAAQFRDGLQIAQNREVLLLAGMGFVEASNLVAVPSVVKSRWRYRIDLEVTLRRIIARSYPVRNLDSATVGLKADGAGRLVVDETITVNPPS